MRIIAFLFTWLLVPICVSASPQSDAEYCYDWVGKKENYKRANTEEHCMRAAEAGVPSAQYSVGMAYGFAGETELEDKYYRLAANQGLIVAYLAMGHSLKEQHPWQAVYWYQRFVAAKPEGYGYAALMNAKIFRELGDEAQAKYWLDVCKASPYKHCE